jgi:hypothetical protein
MKKATKKQEEKQKAQALEERMKRTETKYVKIPLKSSELKLGNLRKILAEHSDKFNEESTVYIEDMYSQSRDGRYVLYGYNEPRYTLTIQSSKEI